MRFYAIKINSAPEAAFPPMPGALVDGAQWCSVYKGPNGLVNDPGAQQIIMDCSEFDAGAGNNATVTIVNPTFLQISSMSDLAALNCIVEVYGGMFKGLPLATSHWERGLTGFLMSGNITQCWGSWTATDMSLSFAFVPSTFQQVSTTQSNPSSVVTAPNTINPSTSTNSSTSRMSRYGPRSIVKQPTVGPTDLGSAIGGAVGGVISNVAGAINNGVVNFAGGALGFIFGGGGTVANALNLIHNLMPNMGLDSAIRQTLQTAFPGAKINISISSSLKLPTQDAGMYQSLSQYAQYLRQLSHSIITDPKYTGIHITSHGPSIDVWDNFSPPINSLISSLGGTVAGAIGSVAVGAAQTLLSGISGGVLNAPLSQQNGRITPQASAPRISTRDVTPVSSSTSTTTPSISQPLPTSSSLIFPTETSLAEIQFVDLIGQPTWIALNTIQVKVVMRCDIHCGDNITLPPSLVIVGEESNIAGNLGPKTGIVNFASESFNVISVRHIGNFFNPDGNDWCTVVEATLNSGSSNLLDTSSPSGLPTTPVTPPAPPPQVLPTPPHTPTPPSAYPQMIRSVRRYM